MVETRQPSVSLFVSTGLNRYLTHLLVLSTYNSNVSRLLQLQMITFSYSVLKMNISGNNLRSQNIRQLKTSTQAPS